jgi:ribosomal protein S10
MDKQAVWSFQGMDKQAVWSFQGMDPHTISQVCKDAREIVKKYCITFRGEITAPITTKGPVVYANINTTTKGQIVYARMLEMRRDCRRLSMWQCSSRRRHQLGPSRGWTRTPLARCAKTQETL